MKSSARRERFVRLLANGKTFQQIIAKIRQFATEIVTVHIFFC